MAVQSNDNDLKDLLVNFNVHGFGMIQKYGNL